MDTNFFIFFTDFLKWKQLFRIVETYFSISFTLLAQMDFLPIGNSIFLVSAISLLAETIIRKKRENNFERKTSLLLVRNWFSG